MRIIDKFFPKASVSTHVRSCNNINNNKKMMQQPKCVIGKIVNLYEAWGRVIPYGALCREIIVSLRHCFWRMITCRIPDFATDLES